jgi:hypothetical protein
MSRIIGNRIDQRLDAQEQMPLRFQVLPPLSQA